MSQTYEYTYSSGSAGDSGLLLGSSGLNSGVVSYSSESYTVGGGSGGVFIGSSGASQGSGSGAVVVSSGGSSSGGVVGQVVNDLLQLNAGSGAAAGAGSSGASYQVTYNSGSASGSGAIRVADGYAYGPDFKSGAAVIRVGADGADYRFGVQASEAAVLESSAFSAIEQAIIRANNPITIQESETITVNGQTGIWANKAEVVNWRGVIPITQYIINEDANPEIIRKQTEQQLIYEQEIAIRYLRPPTPPPPGEILIRQEKNIPTPPAPPLVIRQQPPRPETPAPLVVREAPPRPPAAVGQKVITISGKRLPPPPRKVIIERLAPLPSKPQSIMIERWLPYSQNKRRVIFQRNTVPDPIIAKPRNVIVQWEAPAVTIKKEFKDLGVIRANPVEYVQRYGATLKASVELPSFVREIRPPTGVVLAAEYVAPSLLELEGDVQALSLIDLEREGLAEYRSLVARYASASFASGGAGASFAAGGAGASYSSGGSYSVSYGVSGGLSGGASFGSSGSAGNLNAVLADIFASVDINSNGKISLNEGEKLLLRLNSRLGRSYGEDDVRVFFRALDVNRDGSIDFEEFRRAILKQFA